jgi:Asp-tRNA(Asn)/Glu-tRNA(Gln) amidotransferase A subunit family amidase
VTTRPALGEVSDAAATAVAESAASHADLRPGGPAGRACAVGSNTRGAIASARPVRNVTQPFNVSGQPAISLPVGQTSEGLPIGIQLVARPVEESAILALAAELEAAMPWATRHPSLI